jgi:hypothetical protein
VTERTNLRLGQSAKLRDLCVREAVFLGILDNFCGQRRSGLGCSSDLIDENHLVDEPRVDLGRLEDLLSGRA